MSKKTKKQKSTLKKNLPKKNRASERNKQPSIKQRDRQIIRDTNYL